MSVDYPKRVFRGFLLVAVLILLGAGPLAAKDRYVYRQNINFVKLDTMPKDTIDDVAANHPYDFTVAQMRAMLLSLRIAKKHVIKKDVDQQEIFLPDEAERFAPYLVDAFKQVTPKQWVVMSMVQKRPFFILRNDRLTLAYLWVEGDKLHINFKKTYAKLSGDYEAKVTGERLLKEARGIDVSLEPGPGQRLSDRSDDEMLLDVHHDFSTTAVIAAPASETIVPAARVPPPPVSPDGNRVEDRLRELERLKQEGLVSGKEYDDLRRSILSDI